MGIGTILEAMGNIWAVLGKKRVKFIQILWLGSLAACQISPVQMADPPDLPGPAAPNTPVESPASQPDPEKSGADPAGPPPSTAYQDGINLASSAFTLGQQATSSDDWQLVASRWEQAVQTLQTVSADSQHYPTAQTKLKDYQRNLAYAKQQLETLSQPPPEASLARPNRSNTPPPAAASPRIPIIERRGGTPVIEVSFNGKRYPMILDTGASHTHIPRAMANELGLEVVGQTSVITASSNQTVVDVGYVESVQVGNITRTNIPVSIGDTVPIGLLGNDIYRNFDVILQINSVEFRQR
ncbi:MAG: aspartyl protease family protein [Cyanobacteria bacterium P01_D01_bin.2]